MNQAMNLAMNRASRLLIILSVFACWLVFGVRNASAYFVPPSAAIKAPSSLLANPSANASDEASYHRMIDRVMSAYEPDFRSIGKSLLVERDWKDDKVNAYATRDMQDNPVLRIPGGIARHPLMTEDGFAAIICHEIGHFLGGAPKSKRGKTDLLSWSSSEGAADYFASAKCLRRVFSDESENETVLRSLPEARLSELRTHCENLSCMRALEAGRVVSSVFAVIRGQKSFPSLSDKDPQVVNETYLGHPSAQCRLDTFVAGVRCPVSPEIPLDDRDPKVGACDRPACWFLSAP